MKKIIPDDIKNLSNTKIQTLLAKFISFGLKEAPLLSQAHLATLNPDDIKISDKTSAQSWLTYYNEHKKDFSRCTSLEAHLFAAFISFGLKEAPLLSQAHLATLNPDDIKISDKTSAQSWLTYYNEHKEDFSGCTSLEAHLFAAFISFGVEYAPPLNENHLAILSPDGMQISNKTTAQNWLTYYNEHKEDFSGCDDIKNYLHKIIHLL